MITFIAILIAAVILFGFIVIMLLSRSKRSAPLDVLRGKFYNTQSSGDSIGGFLVSMIANSDAERILRKGSFEYSDFDQCASINRKTCAAFTYIRKDTWPAVFIIPGLGTGIGIIADPQIMWPLVTSFAITDADTNDRNACSNEHGADMFLTTDTGTDCVAAQFRASPFYNASSTGKNIYISNANNSSYPTKCTEHDTPCRLLNSGAGVNVFDLLYNWSCSDNAPCMSFQPKPNSTTDFYVHIGDCPLCNKPYVCIPAESPDGKNVSVQATQINAYVGQNSANWANMYIDNPIVIGSTAVRQCKFKKENVSDWIQALHSFYRALLLSVKTGNQDQVFACPTGPTYLENEINLYIYPDSNSPIYKRQEDIFLKSIMGLFYIKNTCVEQLASLPPHINQTETCGRKIGEAIDVYKTCQGFFAAQDPPLDLSAENDIISQSRAHAIELSSLLERQTGRRIPVYKAVLPSNSFPEPKGLERALNGQSEFEGIFEPI